MTLDACPVLVPDLTVESSWPLSWSDDAPQSQSYRKKAKPQAATVHAGIALTDEVLRNIELRSVLAGVVNKLAFAGEVTSSSRAAACRFLKELPANAPLPKVSPEGDGGVVFAWGSVADGRNLVILEDWAFHVVLNAGTQGAIYHEGLPFAELVPNQVFEAIKA
jgi:hypothetical protein